jgi:hypothetical protein
MFQALGVEIVSHSEDIDPARKASKDALQSDFELDVTVAEPIVLMPGAPAGVAPTATGLKMCGEAATAKNIGCSDIAGRRAGSSGRARRCRGPTDICCDAPAAFANPGCLRAGCSRCTGGTTAPTGGSKWRFCGADATDPAGLHPRNIRRRRLLRRNSCNAWVKLIAMVIESLVEELVGPDTLTIEVFGSRLLDSDVDLFLGPAARYPGEDIMFHIMSRMTTLKPQT